jgi:hypothetical protein
MPDVGTGKSMLRISAIPQPSRSVTLNQRSAKLFYHLAAMRSHSPDICDIRVFVKNHGKSMSVELREGVGGGRDQLAIGLFIPTLRRHARRAAER